MPTGWWRRIPAALILLGFASSLGACAQTTALRRAETAPVVIGVRIEGARELRPEKIRPKLGQQATHPLHWVPLLNFVYPRHHLDEAALQQDRVRIANLYALNGFFDARVVDSGTEVLRLGRDGLARSVRVLYVVEEGKASDVRGVEVVLQHHQDRPFLGTPAEAEELREFLVDGLQIRSSKRFSMEAITATEQLLKSRLLERSHAFAEVAAVVDAFPEEQAVDVRFEARPGNRAVFGAIRLHGLSQVAERYVLRHVKFEAGDPYDGAKVVQTQQAIYNMGTFSLVTVTPELAERPELDDEGRSIVPVDIFVRERKPRTFRGGGGIGWSRGSFDLHGAVSLGHVNLFKRLVRLDLDLEAGFVYLGPEDLGPGGHLKLDLRWPDFPVRTLTLYGTGRVETDVRQGYKYVSPEGDVGLIWSPWKPVRFTLSYNIGYFKLYDNRLDELQQVVDDDIALDDGYFLSVLRQQAVVDLRNNLLAPDRGLLFSLTVDEAGGPLGGRYRYIKATADLRGYIPLGTPRLVLAVRGWASYIHTWGGEDEVPIEEAVFAGGDGSVRGWKTRYLGPRAVEADCDRQDCILPLGGKLGAAGSLELRGRVVSGLWLAGFCDLGRVWASGAEVDSPQRFFEDLQVSVGGGFRYDLGIGRLRVDLGVHPRAWTDPVFREAAWLPPCFQPGGCDDRELRELPAWNFHVGIGESF
ncbi:MAG: BamA/TamA family outer membrane protein [Myxococcota bacterium]|nr:BamA/TamA family outer membrane protein [Myxococcota bacterium]